MPRPRHLQGPWAQHGSNRQWGAKPGLAHLQPQLPSPQGLRCLGPCSHGLLWHQGEQVWEMPCPAPRPLLRNF